jgi:hypothetical protein
VDAQSATAVGGAGSATITLNVPFANGSPQSLVAGMSFIVSDGTGTAEVITATAVNTSLTTPSITAVFAGAHSGTYNVRTFRGSHLGTIVVNDPGTTMVLTLYNGHPAITGSNPGAGKVIAAIKVVAPGYTFNAAVPNGLFYTLTGTPGDLTVLARTSTV